LRHVTRRLHEEPFLCRSLFPATFLKSLEPTLESTLSTLSSTLCRRKPISSFRFSTCTTRTCTAYWKSPITTYWEESDTLFREILILRDFYVEFSRGHFSPFYVTFLCSFVYKSNSTRNNFYLFIFLMLQSDITVRHFRINLNGHQEKSNKHNFSLKMCTSNIADLLRNLSHLEGRCTFDLHAILHFMRFCYSGVANVRTVMIR